MYISNWKLETEGSSSKEYQVTVERTSRLERLSASGSLPIQSHADFSTLLGQADISLERSVRENSLEANSLASILSGASVLSPLLAADRVLSEQKQTVLLGEIHLAFKRLFAVLLSALNKENGGGYCAEGKPSTSPASFTVSSSSSSRQTDSSLRVPQLVWVNNEKTSSVETESYRYQCSGVVETRDGQQCSFEFDLTCSNSTRYQANSESVSYAQLIDPIVINLEAGGAQLDSGCLAFDLDQDGNENEVIRTFVSHSGYLARDLNGDGQINDGGELFGAISGDGFAELRALDADHNNWIDEADPVFSELYVWVPTAVKESNTGLNDEERAGFTESGANGYLQLLSEQNVGALFLGDCPTTFLFADQAQHQLGLLRATSIYLKENGQIGTLQQIDLAIPASS